MVNLYRVRLGSVNIKSKFVFSATSEEGRETQILYRVILVVSELGCIDLDLRCSTILLGK